MFGAKSGYPNCVSCQCTFQGLYFSNVAALLSVVNRFIERIRSFFLNEFFQNRLVGIISSELRLVAIVSAAPNRIGFSKQSSRIKREYGNGKIVAKDFVRDQLIFEAKAGRERNL